MKKINPAHKVRRSMLIERIKKEYKVEQGIVLLVGGFEGERARFRQQSTFYYYTGITEPGCVVTIDMQNNTTVYMPQYAESRSRWVAGCLAVGDDAALLCNVDRIQYLGKPYPGYTISPLASDEIYADLIASLSGIVVDGSTVFVAVSKLSHENLEHRAVVQKLETALPGLHSLTKDISSLVAAQRRIKSKEEIELIYKAVDLTVVAQEAAARVICADKNERELQAGIEYIFAESGGTAAFPTIVAGGKNSTVLHYNENSQELREHELVVVDCGAELNYYCGDLTRTYPVSGMFSKRQREIYELVLETQAYIADVAKPGMWLKNPAHPEKSLHHLAVEFLKKRGYDQYFVHGIGHYLGLDVHDVGSYAEPLQEGDVITIEPGIYIPEESIGIRIEDNYWIIKDGNVCLSESLPKDLETIEKMVQQGFDDEESESFEDSAEDFDEEDIDLEDLN